MKTGITVWMLLVLAAGAVAQQAKTPVMLLQEARYAEQTQGDLDRAIELYQQVLDRAAETEQLAAQATYQIGLCYLKKGDNDQAANYFRLIVSKYAAQKILFGKARMQLDKMSQQNNVLIARKLPIETLELKKGITKEEIKSLLGHPEEEKENWLNYNKKYGIDFYIDRNHIELRLNPGFEGQLSTGITLNSTADDLFQAYGQPKRTEETGNLMNKFEEGVLYRMGDAGKFPLEKRGLLFWLKGDRVSQIVLFDGIVEGAKTRDAREWVENFFKHNFRDITSRKTLEWGEPVTDADGNISIRYQFEGKIWDKETMVGDMIFTFDPNGKFVSRQDVVDTSSKEGLQRLVMDFFKHNYRDITSRKTLEWGDPVDNPDGTVSIRYKYEATIRGKDKVVNDEIFTFMKDGTFVSVKKVK